MDDKYIYIDSKEIKVGDEAYLDGNWVELKKSDLSSTLCKDLIKKNSTEFRRKKEFNWLVFPETKYPDDWTEKDIDIATRVIYACEMVLQKQFGHPDDWVKKSSVNKYNCGASYAIDDGFDKWENKG